MNGNLSGFRTIALAVSKRITADDTTAAVDVSEFQGVCKVHLNHSVMEGASQTADVKLTHCDTSGGTYTDVSGAAFTQVTTAGGASMQEITINADNLKKFVKVVNDLGGSTPAGTYGVTLTGVKQQG